MSPRPPRIHHCTPEPLRLYGRTQELALLDSALADTPMSLVAMIGPGGQGKTAIVQTWLQSFLRGTKQADGVFLWSFYRGKDSDLCLRELYRYAEQLDRLPDVSAAYCVDHLLPVLRREMWAIVLDGAEVVQHETGSWFGRFVHPELARLLEEVATEAMPGVVVLTTRFPLPTLAHRHHARLISLESLDRESAIGLLQGLGVQGEAADLEAAVQACGHHAKAVELLGTWLVHFHAGRAERWRDLPATDCNQDASEEETRVARVLAAFQQMLPQEAQDILALATAFRHPPAEDNLLAYLASEPVRKMLHEQWQRRYVPFAQRDRTWLKEQLDELVQLRLLERVHAGVAEAGAMLVIDAHPLVRRGFEHVLSADPQTHARARAGFLRGRPDRRPPTRLEDAREEVELFHAWCEAGMWNEADSVYVALDNPKHRFLAPAFERDLLLSFFPGGDWRQPPLWSGFGRYRSLAMCHELLGDFESALEIYRPADGPLRGDALIALGRLEPLLETEHVGPPWQSLWQAYRCHALALAGCADEARRIVRTLVPVDIYEWVHVFECLLRLGEMHLLDIRSVLYRPPHAQEHHWSWLARRRMQLDHRRITSQHAPEELGQEYTEVIEQYDFGGLPFERTLTRLSYARWLLAMGDKAAAKAVLTTALQVSRRHDMQIMTADALELLHEIAPSDARQAEAQKIRGATGHHGPPRP